MTCTDELATTGIPGAWGPGGGGAFNVLTDLQGVDTLSACRQECDLMPCTYLNWIPDPPRCEVYSAQIADFGSFILEEGEHLGESRRFCAQPV